VTVKAMLRTIEAAKRVQEAFGSQSYDGVTNVAYSLDRLWLGGPWTPAHSGKIIKMGLRIKAGPGGNAKLVIASSSGGVPGAILALSNPISLATISIDLTATMSSVFSVVGGTDYFIGFGTDGGAIGDNQGTIVGVSGKTLYRYESVTYSTLSTSSTIPAASGTTPTDAAYCWAVLQVTKH
jgi:hypothetical protein